MSTAGMTAVRGPFDPTVPAVRGAVGILRFVFDHSECRAHAIADGLGINRSTCHGILKTLVAGGLLDFDESAKTYSFGPVIVAMGAKAWEASNSVRVARPLLERWVATTRFTIFLARLLPDHHFLVIDRLESTQNIKITVAIGERFPLVAAALGKAYLAWLPREEARDLLEHEQLLAFTRNSITFVPDYIADLEDTRRQGYSVSRREYYGGSNAVAAPVFGPEQRVAMVVCSLAADTDLTNENMNHYGTSIRRLADRISSKLLMTDRLPEPFSQDREAAQVRS
jgi:DNA-binding IclR family transcriptional regulator